MTSVFCVTTVDLSLWFLLRNSLRHQQQLGYAVTGVCAPGRYVADLRQAGIPVMTVPMTRRITPLQDVRCLLQLVRLFRLHRPDIVHTHTPKANLLGQLAARWAGVPVRVSTVHGFYFTRRTPLPKRLFFQGIETLSARFAHRLFLINQEDVSTAAALRIYPPERIRLLPGGLGIDLDEFSPERVSGASREAQRAALGLPHEARVVGFVGRLVREKGVRELFAAFRDVAAQIPNARLLVVGPYDAGKADAVPPETAREFGIAERCIFTGMRTDVRDLYPLMDVFVLPSHREGFPRAPMEASAMGVPCVVTDVRGCRDVVTDGRNGLVVPPEDPGALGSAILKVLAQPELARQLSAEGRRMARERFDERLAFEAVEAEYVRLLAERVPRGARA